jgi:homogentisate 1,2-dioxygenase
MENLTADFRQGTVTPNQLRWKPFPIPSEKVDWVRSLFTICGSGCAAHKEGFAIHVYTATESMKDTCLANADGDFLIVPQDDLCHSKRYKVPSGPLWRGGAGICA